MPKYIALAEDDTDDQLLFTEALKQVSNDNKLTTVSNGMLLLDLLKNNAAALPDVIVLDVNMPGMSGIECLKIIRSNPAFHHVPVVIMSTSTDPKTIDDAFTSGASRYAVKPGAFDDLKTIIKNIIGNDLASAFQSRTRHDFMLGSGLAYV